MLVTCSNLEARCAVPLLTARKFTGRGSIRPDRISPPPRCTGGVHSACFYAPNHTHLPSPSPGAATNWGLNLVLCWFGNPSIKRNMCRQSL